MAGAKLKFSLDQTFKAIKPVIENVDTWGGLKPLWGEDTK